MEQQPSLKKNYLFNIFVQIVNVLYPLITIPYITRVLGPETLGKVNFALSFVQYFILFANLGVGVYASREISKARRDVNKLNQTFSELFSIMFFSSIFFSIAYLLSFLFIDKIRTDITLYLIVGIPLFLNQMSVSWFFLGIENFKYFAIRNIIFKIITIILIFVFVRTHNDYLLYAFILSLSIFGANILDFTLTLKYIKVSLTFEITKHFKPLLIFFISSIFSVLYSGIDVIVLGFIEQTNYDKFAGLFTTAKKIILLILFLLNSIINVNYMRLSFLISQNKEEEYKELINKTTNFLMLVSFLAFTITFSFSTEILALLGGTEFIEATLTLKVLSILLITNILRNILESNVLNPKKLEKFVLMGNIIAWTLCFVSLFPLTLLLSYDGTSIALLIGDIANFVFFTIISVKYLKINPITKNIITYAIVSTVIIGINELIHSKFKIQIDNILNCLIYTSFLSGLYTALYITILATAKDQTIKEIYEYLKELINSKLTKKE